MEEWLDDIALHTKTVEEHFALLGADSHHLDAQATS